LRLLRAEPGQYKGAFGRRHRAHVETVNSGQYPLSRPLFIYVSRPALEQNPSVEESVSFYLDEANIDQFAEQALYVPLSEPAAQEAREQLENRTLGSSPDDAKGGEKGKAKEKGKEEEKKE
jgi:hypothetical protein